MSDIKFVDGLFVDQPHEKAPDFVKARLSIDRKKLGNWLRNETDDRINIDIKEAKSGKWYAAVDSWKPDPDKATPAREAANNTDPYDPITNPDSDVPF